MMTTGSKKVILPDLFIHKKISKIVSMTLKEEVLVLNIIRM